LGRRQPDCRRSLEQLYSVRRGDGAYSIDASGPQAMTAGNKAHPYPIRNTAQMNGCQSRIALVKRNISRHKPDDKQQL